MLASCIARAAATNVHQAKSRALMLYRGKAANIGIGERKPENSRAMRFAAAEHRHCIISMKSS